MSVTTTYAHLVEISEMEGRLLRDDELGQYWSVTMPRSLACLEPNVANWLLATHDATTIDSMYRLAKDYVLTVVELYNERTTT